MLYIDGETGNSVALFDNNAAIPYISSDDDLNRESLRLMLENAGFLDAAQGKSSKFSGVPAADCCTSQRTVNEHINALETELQLLKQAAAGGDGSRILSEVELGSRSGLNSSLPVAADNKQKFAVGGPILLVYDATAHDIIEGIKLEMRNLMPEMQGSFLGPGEIEQGPFAAIIFLTNRLLTKPDVQEAIVACESLPMSRVVIFRETDIRYDAPTSVDGLFADTSVPQKASFCKTPSILNLTTFALAVQAREVLRRLINVSSTREWGSTIPFIAQKSTFKRIAITKALGLLSKSTSENCCCGPSQS